MKNNYSWWLLTEILLPPEILAEAMNLRYKGGITHHGFRIIINEIIDKRCQHLNSYLKLNE